MNKAWLNIAVAGLLICQAANIVRMHYTDRFQEETEEFNERVRQELFSREAGVVLDAGKEVDRVLHDTTKDIPQDQLDSFDPSTDALPQPRRDQ